MHASPTVKICFRDLISTFLVHSASLLLFFSVFFFSFFFFFLSFFFSFSFSFSSPLPTFYLRSNWLKSVSRVGLRNKIGHPAYSHKPFKQVLVVN